MRKEDAHLFALTGGDIPECPSLDRVSFPVSASDFPRGFFQRILELDNAVPGGIQTGINGSPRGVGIRGDNGAQGDFRTGAGELAEGRQGIPVFCDLPGIQRIDRDDQQLLCPCRFLQPFYHRDCLQRASAMMTIVDPHLFDKPRLKRIQTPPQQAGKRPGSDFPFEDIQSRQEEIEFPGSGIRCLRKPAAGRRPNTPARSRSDSGIACGQ